MSSRAPGACMGTRSLCHQFWCHLFHAKTFRWHSYLVLSANCPVIAIVATASRPELRPPWGARHLRAGHGLLRIVSWGTRDPAERRQPGIRESHAIPSVELCILFFEISKFNRLPNENVFPENITVSLKWYKVISKVIFYTRLKIWAVWPISVLG